MLHETLNNAIKGFAVRFGAHSYSLRKNSQFYRRSGHTVYATVAQSVYILPSMCHERVLSDVHTSSQSIHVEEKLRETNNNGAHALSRSLANRLNENQLCRNNKIICQGRRVQINSAKHFPIGSGCRTLGQVLSTWLSWL